MHNRASGSPTLKPEELEIRRRIVWAAFGECRWRVHVSRCKVLDRLYGICEPDSLRQDHLAISRPTRILQRAGHARPSPISRPLRRARTLDAFRFRWIVPISWISSQGNIYIYCAVFAIYGPRE